MLGLASIVPLISKEIVSEVFSQLEIRIMLSAVVGTSESAAIAVSVGSIFIFSRT